MAFGKKSMRLSTRDLPSSPSIRPRSPRRPRQSTKLQRRVHDNNPIILSYQDHSLFVKEVRKMYRKLLLSSRCDSSSAKPSRVAVLRSTDRWISQSRHANTGGLNLRQAASQKGTSLHCNRGKSLPAFLQFHFLYRRDWSVVGCQAGPALVLLYGSSEMLLPKASPRIRFPKRKVGG